MSIWTRLGKGGLTAAKAGRRLQQAGREADEPTAQVAAVDAPFTLAQAVLLLRYVAGHIVLGYLELVFLLKYALLGLGVLALFVDTVRPLGIALIVLFLLAALVQWIVTRSIGRLAAFHRLEGLDDLAAETTTVWWPNLKRELTRVGLPARGLAVLRLSGRYATRTLSEQQTAAVDAIEWRAVIPQNEWNQARRTLVDATAHDD